MLLVYCLVPFYMYCTCLSVLILFWYILYLFIRAGFFFVCLLYFYTIVDFGCFYIVVYFFTRDVFCSISIILLILIVSVSLCICLLVMFFVLFL